MQPAAYASVLILFSIAAFPAGDQKPVKIDFGRLRGLNYRTGRVTADVKALDGETVRISGYIVPLEDGMDQATEFLLQERMPPNTKLPTPRVNDRAHSRPTARPSVA